MLFLKEYFNPLHGTLSANQKEVEARLLQKTIRGCYASFWGWQEIWNLKIGQAWSWIYYFCMINILTARSTSHLEMYLCRSGSRGPVFRDTHWQPIIPTGFHLSHPPGVGWCKCHGSFQIHLRKSRVACWLGKFYGNNANFMQTLHIFRLLWVL